MSPSKLVVTCSDSPIGGNSVVLPSIEPFPGLSNTPDLRVWNSPGLMDTVAPRDHGVDLHLEL
jgi:hypothetical protein